MTTRPESRDRPETALLELAGDGRSSSWIVEPGVPHPPIAPAGPGREIWPVRPVPAKELGSGFFDLRDDEAV